MKTLFKPCFVALFILTVAVAPGFAVGFKTVLYTGSGATQSVTGVGFKPDLVWIKSRTPASHHQLYDSIRGAGNILYPSASLAEAYYSNQLTGFDNNGFTVGSGEAVNQLNQTFVAWCWKADHTGITNANQTERYSSESGLSIIKFSGDGITGRALQHSLGAKPKMVIVKSTTDVVEWAVYHESLGATDYVFLNTTQGTNSASTVWNDTEPSSSVVTLGNWHGVNMSGRDYIAYIFSEVPGISSFGTYTGNGNAVGPIVDFGFEPAFLMVKQVNSTGHWLMYDNKRDSQNPNTHTLWANLSNAENTNNAHINLIGTGFQLVTISPDVNASGGQYVYMAFADLSFDQSGVFSVDGKIGVGVINPTDELEVKGTIKSQEVIVTTDPQEWPDYVFDKNYRLRSIKDLNSYIQTNRRLPGIPTAEQLSESGIPVSEILKMQMQKIEELTLYIIEQDRRINELQAQ